ncbi:hypothetical protein HanXRQr2_Chr10g0463451 [Helianthus annuus]|uniref:Uncharacterized protein n=2 Tax=Helianthus annuus TaxID=4232 RepID=A0A9K3I241_HELAN|nr:hypothetical protein HanXRQr2_Chr10g0463451 [Helianthus annuus]
MMSFLKVLKRCKIGSKCPIVTDNYCEDAYDVFQNAILKKIM